MRKVLFAITVVIMVLGMLMAGGCDLFSSSNQTTPDDTIKALMSAMENQDAGEIAALTGEDMADIDLEGYHALKSYEIGEVTVLDDDKAAITVKIEFEEDGYEFALDYIFELTKTDGKWYVTHADIAGFWDPMGVD